jgi:nucleoside-diphosphate-sugar epimerase
MARVPQRILITGASGFVGQHLMVSLAAAFPGVTLVTPEFDIADAAVVSGVVRDAAPDACVHLAAISTIAEAQKDREATWRVNLHGTLHLAEAILLHAPDCQLVFASSTEVYGASFQRASTLDETAQLMPRNLYAAVKAAAELTLCSMIDRGLRVVRPRPVNHTGPGQSPQFVVPAFARQVARIAAGLQEPVMHVGNLDSRREFLDVRDVCAAYTACIARRDDLEPGAIFNLAAGTLRRIGDILDDLKDLAGVTAAVRIDAPRTRVEDGRTAIVDASAARDGLGWLPGTPWRQTLADVLDDWRHRIATET